MADDAFKLPGASYETVCRVVRGYASVGTKTNLDTVAGIVGTAPGEVSRNTGFLVSVGLLEGGRDKGATDLAIRLARALEFDETDDVAAAWREALSGQPLIQRIIAAIRVRGGMDPATLQAQIVYTAGADKNARTLAGGAAVAEMMRVAGLIAERDGQVIAVSLSETPTQRHASEESADSHAASEAHSSSLPPLPTIQRVVETSGGVSVRVDVRISVSAQVGEIAMLGDQLREMLARLEAERGDTVQNGGSSDEQA
jgi:hypothetical protein